MGVYTIGIGGGKCSGKTHFIEELSKDFKDLEFRTINLKKYETNGCPDHPSNYDWSRLKEEITHAQQEKGNKVLVVEGNLAFSEEYITDLFDLKVYIESSNSTRFFRNLKKDMSEGVSFIKAAKNYIFTTNPAHKKYIKPTKKGSKLNLPIKDLEENRLKNIYQSISSHIQQEMRKRS